MKTKTLIIFLLLPMLSFAQNLELNYQKRKIRKEIRKIVAKIAEGDELHSEFIGYSGKTTRQYKHFERLIKKASLEEMVEEIKHLCSRIFQIENEIKTYKTLRNNLSDGDEVDLTLQELMQYGFE